MLFCLKNNNNNNNAWALVARTWIQLCWGRAHIFISLSFLTLLWFPRTARMENHNFRSSFSKQPFTHQVLGTLKYESDCISSPNTLRRFPYDSREKWWPCPSLSYPWWARPKRAIRLHLLKLCCFLLLHAPGPWNIPSPTLGQSLGPSDLCSIRMLPLQNYSAT